MFSISILNGKAPSTKKKEKTTPHPNRNVGGEKKNHVNIPVTIGSCESRMVRHRSGFPIRVFSTRRVITSAASAATIISVAGHRRFITGNSHMLIHQISSSFWGKMNEFEDEMQNLSLLTKYIMKIYKDNTNLTVKKMKDIFKKDLWMPADECLKMGLVDEIK